MKLTGFEGSDYLLGRMVFAMGILGIFVGVLVSPPIPKVKRRDFSYLLYAIPRAFPALISLIVGPMIVSIVNFGEY